MNDLWNVISAGLSLASVFVAAFAVLSARRTALTGTYFSEMTKAYADYLHCVADFVLRRGAAERDTLASALYRLQLFASSEIASDAQDLYATLLNWAQSNPTNALQIDSLTNDLGAKMKAHLDRTRKRGNP